MSIVLGELKEKLAQEGYEVIITDDVLSVKNKEGLIASIIESDTVIIANCILYPMSEISKQEDLNSFILRTATSMPLTNVNIQTIDNEDYYVASGELSADSKMESLLKEVEYLFDNSEDLTVVMSEFV